MATAIEHGALHVLVVEDNEVVLEIASCLLDELGHEATAVASGEAALAQLQSTLFDLLITDISLPGISGVDLAQRVAEAQPALPIIVSSGYPDATAALLSRKLAHPVFVLTKPYDLALLEQVIDEARRSSSP